MEAQNDLIDLQIEVEKMKLKYEEKMGNLKTKKIPLTKAKIFLSTFKNKKINI